MKLSSTVRPSALVARTLGCAALSAGLVLASASGASAATTVSQATAQAVHANVANLLNVNVSNPATAASNDGTQTNADQTASPLVSLLGTQDFLGPGALKEVAEANTDGSSYGCAGVVSPGAGIQVGATGKTCSATGNGTGGVTLDLGELPGLGTLATVAGGDIKVTVDSVVANGYRNGTDTPVLDADVAGITAQLGTGTPVNVPIPSGPNQNLLTAVLSALAPQLGLLGTVVSNLITPVVTLTTNYQPTGGVPTVTGLHVALLGTTAVVDLATVTVGPNVAVAAVDAFSFASLPLVLGGIALLIALGLLIRSGVRRVRVRVTA